MYAEQMWAGQGVRGAKQHRVSSSSGPKTHTDANTPIYGASGKLSGTRLAMNAGRPQALYKGNLSSSIALDPRGLR